MKLLTTIALVLTIFTSSQAFSARQEFFLDCGSEGEFLGASLHKTEHGFIAFAADGYDSAIGRNTVGSDYNGMTCSNQGNAVKCSGTWNKGAKTDVFFNLNDRELFVAFNRSPIRGGQRVVLPCKYKAY